MILRPAAFFAAALTALLFAVAPADAGAHAAFLDSQPRPGERLEAGPTAITLTFTEPLNQSLSRASLRDAESGKEVPARIVSGKDARELILQPKARLGRAPYEVEWHTVSTLDGHALEGSFGFGVRTAALSGEHSVEQSPLARDGWVRIAARALLYAALAFFAGGLFGAALLSRRAGPVDWLVPPALAGPLGAERRRALAEDAWDRTCEVGWLAVGAATAVVIGEASDAAGGLSAQGLADFLFSNAAGLARAWTVALIVLATLLARRAPLVASGWLALGFLSIAFSGHANAAEYSGTAVVNDWLHLLAGAVWLGGIAQIALTWLPLLRRGAPDLGRAVAASVLPRFGEIALPAFLLVAVTGVTSAIFQLGHLDALWSTAYGRVLIVKVALVALIALASYLHAFRLRPRLLAANPHPPPRLARHHWRVLSVEPLLGLGVLAAVAALVAFPLPPQQLGESEGAEAAAPCEPSCPLPEARSGELAVAEQAGSRVAAFWLRREGAAIVGTLRLLGRNAKPVDAPVEIEGGSLTGCGVGCWSLRVPGRPERLAAVVEEQGRTYRASVPSRWTATMEPAARKLVSRAQQQMRALRTLRMNEETTSGPGSFVGIRYRFRAPDRMAYETSSGGRVVAIGKSSYNSIGGGSWTRRGFGADGFRLATFFRWSAYARSIRWLGPARLDGRRVIELALYERATPLWYRLAIDPRKAFVLSEWLITPAHFMERRFFALNQPTRIERPR